MKKNGWQQTVLSPTIHTWRGTTMDGNACEPCQAELQVLWVWGLSFSKQWDDGTTSYKIEIGRCNHTYWSTHIDILYRYASIGIYQLYIYIYLCFKYPLNIHCIHKGSVPQIHVIMCGKCLRHVGDTNFFFVLTTTMYTTRKLVKESICEQSSWLNFRDSLQPGTWLPSSISGQGFIWIVISNFCER